MGEFLGACSVMQERGNFPCIILLMDLKFGSLCLRFLFIFLLLSPLQATKCILYQNHLQQYRFFFKEENKKGELIL